jgi:diadenosine tetraphosphatase ApaH/serine/threonine PP2A family protein phosphatase
VKYALVADVHANLEALTAVLDHISRDGVDRVVCLGDIVGYNASPNACVETLRALGTVSIAGNHDRAAVGAKSTERFGRSARRALEWTRPRLTEENRDYLAALPSHLLVDDRFFVVHGALHPEPNDELHLSSDARVARSLEELVTGRFGSNLCFFGHSHLPVIYELRKGRMRRLGDSDAVLLPDGHYLVNPGSVGQSRDGDWRAAYALFDTERSRVELRRVPYDVARVEHSTRLEGLAQPERWPAASRDWLEKQIDRGCDRLLHRVRRLGAKLRQP